MTNVVRLSVTIITLNEERNIGRCLDSVASVADEIVVVDSGSTDRTREICESRGARFIEQPFLGYVQQKNFALDRASYEHVLSVDADECLTPELTKRIQAVKSDWTADGFTMNRSNNYYGRWMRYSAVYPDRKLRLWRRDKGRWGGNNPHDKVIMHNGASVRHLGADLSHYPYDSVHSHVKQANKFSSIAARAYLEADKRSNMVKVVAHPAHRFLRDYVLRRGFLDGFHGFMVCSINAYMTFLKYAKMRDLQRSQATAGGNGNQLPR